MGVKTAISSHKTLFFLLFIYVLFRILILNVNYTEWGDTFRMIRGADYISRFDWPWDEKRWPFYSVLLVPGIWLNAPILWGRVLSLVVSVGTLVLIYMFCLRYISRSKKYAILAVILTATSSVFAYWSLRVMADVVFAFLILLYFYLFLSWCKTKVINVKHCIILSVISLMLTMTRLEGIFAVAGTFLFFLLKKNWKAGLVFYIPQMLVYVPWTFYAKVLYQGPVQNDYLNEVQGFIFNIDRFIYFFTYTTFILAVPILTYFVVVGGFNCIQKLKRKDWTPFIPIVMFVLLEFIIGFIWTPSLPRIYMPIIPFLVMLAVYGLQRFKAGKRPLSFVIIGIFLTFMFTMLQFKLRLYFLGASRVLFAGIIILNLIAVGVVLTLKKRRVSLAGLLILINVLISFVVINNQRNIYRTVLQGIRYIEKNSDPAEKVAYSDETGNTEWYLRGRSYYLPATTLFVTSRVANEAADEQYALLKKESVDYLLWTNEFNRGSYFVDPRVDSRYMLLAVYQQPMKDPFDSLLERIGIIDSKEYTVFKTKVYKVK